MEVLSQRRGEEGVDVVYSKQSLQLIEDSCGEGKKR